MEFRGGTVIDIPVPEGTSVPKKERVARSCKLSQLRGLLLRRHQPISAVHPASWVYVVMNSVRIAHLLRMILYTMTGRPFGLYGSHHLLPISGGPQSVFHPASGSGANVLRGRGRKTRARYPPILRPASAIPDVTPTEDSYSRRRPKGSVPAGSARTDRRRIAPAGWISTPAGKTILSSTRRARATGYSTVRGSEVRWTSRRLVCRAAVPTSLAS